MNRNGNKQIYQTDFRESLRDYPKFTVVEFRTKLKFTSNINCSYNPVLSAWQIPLIHSPVPKKSVNI